MSGLKKVVRSILEILSDDYKKIEPPRTDDYDQDILDVLCDHRISNRKG